MLACTATTLPRESSTGAALEFLATLMLVWSCALRTSSVPSWSEAVPSSEAATITSLEPTGTSARPEPTGSTSTLFGASARSTSKKVA